MLCTRLTLHLPVFPYFSSPIFSFMFPVLSPHCFLSLPFFIFPSLFSVFYFSLLLSFPPFSTLSVFLLFLLIAVFLSSLWPYCFHPLSIVNFHPLFSFFTSLLCFFQRPLLILFPLILVYFCSQWMTIWEHLAYCSSPTIWAPLFPLYWGTFSQNVLL